jgi:hypothetical protein
MGFYGQFREPTIRGALVIRRDVLEVATSSGVISKFSMNLRELYLSPLHNPQAPMSDYVQPPFFF